MDLLPNPKVVLRHACECMKCATKANYGHGIMFIWSLKNDASAFFSAKNLQRNCFQLPKCYLIWSLFFLWELCSTSKPLVMKCCLDSALDDLWNWNSAFLHIERKFTYLGTIFLQPNWELTWYVPKCWWKTSTLKN